MDRFFDRTPDFQQIEVTDMYHRSGQLNDKLLDPYGGWIEILDESGNVISVLGNKTDSIHTYSDAQLYRKMDIYRNHGPIAYHAYPIDGPNGEPYVLLWKIHQGPTVVFKALGVFAGLFIISLIIALYFYTRYSVRQVKKPLKQIVQGIREMERFQYETRLNFFAEKEFADIRNAFNGMAERLQQASEAKAATERNKRSMLLHLSHDLKTPITSIYGYSQLLLDKPRTNEHQRRKYLQYIHDKSSYMHRLIQDLFELANLENDQFQLNIEKVNISKWFQQQIAEFYTEIEEKGCQLKADIPEKPLYAKLDKDHMNRVIANMISNALKYNPKETTLYASCEQKDGCAVLWLGDNGVGFQYHVQAHLFEEFVRGSNPGKDSTGLGLAICKKIITHHHGEIELVKDEHYPTLFRITLPSVEGS